MTSAVAVPMLPVAPSTATRRNGRAGADATAGSRNDAMAKDVRGIKPGFLRRETQADRCQHDERSPPPLRPPRESVADAVTCRRAARRKECHAMMHAPGVWIGSPASV